MCGVIILVDVPYGSYMVGGVMEMEFGRTCFTLDCQPLDGSIIYDQDLRIRKMK
jgi:hypothetical protein